MTHNYAARPVPSRHGVQPLPPDELPPYLAGTTREVFCSEIFYTSPQNLRYTTCSLLMLQRCILPLCSKLFA